MGTSSSNGLDLRIARAVMLPALVIMLGMQILRVFFPGLVWYLTEVVGLPSVSLAYYAFGTFLVGFLAPVLRRLLGARTALRLSAAGVAIFRLAEQLVTEPGVNFWLSAGGSALFIIFLPLYLSHIRALRGVRAAPVWTHGLLLGLSIDSAVKGLTGTLDLSWIPGIGPALFVLISSFAVLWLVWLEINPGRSAASETGWADALPLLGLGPYLYLQTIILQNHGWVAQVAVISPSLGFFVLMLGNLLAVLGAAYGLARPHTFRLGLALLAGAYLLGATYTADRPGTFFAVTVIVTQFVLGWVWALISTVVAPASRPGARQTTIVVAVGMMLFLAIAFGYYIALDLALPFSRAIFPPLAGFLFGLGVIYASLRVVRVGRTPWRDSTPIYIAAVLLIAPLFVLITNLSPPASEPPGSMPLRAIVYNIHSAYNPEGVQDPEAIAQVIEASGAEVIGLQEVSRGWLINGSTDLVAWLSRRLEMPILFQGTTDPVWGNAIMTRLPILEDGQALLPKEGTIIARGFIWASIDVGAAEPLLFVNTHLHQIDGDTEPRQRQVQAILAFAGDVAPAMIGGDMNAQPGSPEMGLLASAGFRDVWTEAGEGDGFTFSSTNPEKRIDWIWASTDLTVLEAEVPSTTASDHLPVVTTVDQ